MFSGSGPPVSRTHVPPRSREGTMDHRLGDARAPAGFTPPFMGGQRTGDRGWPQVHAAIRILPRCFSVGSPYNPGLLASKPSASGTTSFLSFFLHCFCTKNISHEIYALKFLSLELVRLAYPKFYSLFPSPPSPWQAPFHSLILRIYFRCLR